MVEAACCNPNIHARWHLKHHTSTSILFDMRWFGLRERTNSKVGVGNQEQKAC